MDRSTNIYSFYRVRGTSFLGSHWADRAAKTPVWSILRLTEKVVEGKKGIISTRVFSFVYRRFGERFFQQQIAEDFVTVFGQLVLLGSAAVVLERQDDWPIRCDKGAVTDGENNVLSIKN